MRVIGFIGTATFPSMCDSPHLRAGCTLKHGSGSLMDPMSTWKHRNFIYKCILGWSYFRLWKTSLFSIMMTSWNKLCRPDAKIWRLGGPGKLRGDETETVFLSWLGWLHYYFVDFSILPAFPCKTAVPPRGVPSEHAWVTVLLACWLQYSGSIQSCLSWP